MKLLVVLVLEIYWYLLRLTIRLRIRGLELVEEELGRGLVPVFAVPHHTILLSALAYGHRPATLLASLSKDGELAAQFLKRRGFSMVRGSSSRGGQQALESLKEALGSGQAVAVTFDGPRGPRLVPKAGVAVCGWYASGAVYLLKHTILPSWFFPGGLCVRLKSWDRFILPLPGCRVATEFFKIQVPEKTTQSKEDWVSGVLMQIETETKTFYDR